jgi:two-component system, sensor histidine kinase and response regulator
VRQATSQPGHGERKFLATEHAVALILSETTDTADAYPMLLEAIGTSLGWQFGALWEEVPGREGSLQCAEVWCSDEARLAKFAWESRGTVLAPGLGLPGRVWSSGRPAWIRDVRADPNFPRAHAAAASGPHAAFCFRSGRAAVSQV